MQTPEDKGEMTGGTWSLHVWDLEFEGVRLWRRDSRRQAPSLEASYGREVGFHPVVSGEPLKDLNRRMRSYAVDGGRESGSTATGEPYLGGSLQESSGKATLVELQLSIAGSACILSASVPC